MARKKKKQNQKRQAPRKEKLASRFALPDEIKRLIWAAVLFVIAVIVFLSFFELAGAGGELFIDILVFLFGKARFAIPIFLILGGLALFGFKYKNKWPVALSLILLTVGLSGTFEVFNHELRRGGWVGYLASWPLLEAFGAIATQLVFAALMLVGLAILWQFLYKPREKDEEDETEVKIKTADGGDGPSIRKIFGPKFKVKSLEPIPQAEKPRQEEKNSQELELKPRTESRLAQDYNFPPLDMLESDKGVPTAGDIRINSAIIKRTLQNFDIQVEMSEVNIGPTVTQYTLKPAEGVKLTRITSLSNDLSLALAAHPLRIEAPIPGRPLVGIEVPNSNRTVVRLKNLLEHQRFQNSASTLTLALGRDVAGSPVFADLAKMPHLLVAGSTGTGKTICLNTLITTLLYENSPETLRLILIDPKRVEFPVYNDLPHLLTPVIFDAQKSVNAFKWLIGEMERRFGVLSEAKARDIKSYNEIMAKQGNEMMPYIVLVVDELADLMASRGREIEAAIVRLAQMARAVGIHLILATQRPSVEVITGLIKANITSRITFQVASQVDSRTILDTAGAEKLLGAGDMLFLSAEISKPKRTQAAYVSDKEVRKVVKYVRTENPSTAEETEENPEVTSDSQKEDLTESLEKTLENGGAMDFMGGEDDPLYEEAKKVVIESKKASASLLQRRLRVGYARAARLIDMLEEKGVVGPGEGAKPREIIGSSGAKSPPKTAIGRRYNCDIINEYAQEKRSQKEKIDLQEAVDEIKQRFGEGAIMKLRDVRAVDVDVIPTGAISLNLALGVGGVPRGRVIEIFGPESSGKSTLALHICAEAQKRSGVAAFVDAEHALDPDYAKRIGVNVEDLLISQPDSGEQALQIVETLVMSGELDVIVIDSVAALTPKAEIAGEIGDQHIGLQARLMSQALRKLASVVARTKTSVVFLNQTRMKIGVMFGNPETTPGGLALKFYSSVRIDLRRIAQIKQGESIVGSRVRAKIVKNKVAAPFKTAEFDIYYNEGISRLGDLLNTALKTEIIKKSGSWFQFEDQKIGQGVEGAKKFLKENPAVVKKIEAAVNKEIREQ